MGQSEARGRWEQLASEWLPSKNNLRNLGSPSFDERFGNLANREALSEDIIEDQNAPSFDALWLGHSKRSSQGAFSDRLPLTPRLD